MEGIGLEQFLIVGLLVFALGLYTVLTRKNAIGILMGVELILNAANINYIAFARYGGASIDGQVFAIFVITVAAGEAAVGLAIIIQLYRLRSTINVDEATDLNG